MLAARDLSPGEDQGNGITVVGSVFAGLATLAVVGRFSARRLKRLRYGPDDWMALAALVCQCTAIPIEALTVLGVELDLLWNHGPR